MGFIKAEKVYNNLFESVACSNYLLLSTIIYYYNYFYYMLLGFDVE